MRVGRLYWNCCLHVACGVVIEAHVVGGATVVADVSARVGGDITVSLQNKTQANKTMSNEVPQQQQHRPTNQANNIHCRAQQERQKSLVLAQQLTAQVGDPLLLNSVQLMAASVAVLSGASLDSEKNSSVEPSSSVVVGAVVVHSELS